MLFSCKKRINNSLSFYGDDEYHIKKVLRKKIGDNIFCTWEGKKYEGTIYSIEPLLVEITREISEKEYKTPKIGLFQAIVKQQNFNWIVQKSGEIGVDIVNPIVLERCQKNRVLNVEKMIKIIKSTSVQSNQIQHTKLGDVMEINDLVNNLSNYDYVLIPYEKQDNANSLISSLEKINYKLNEKIGIVVGPEGGFTNREIELLKKLKTKVFFVHLTNSILRSETASLYTIAVTKEFIQNKLNETNESKRKN